MPFDPSAESTPFISVEGPGMQSPAQSSDRPAALRKNRSVVLTPRSTDDYEGQILGMRNEITDLIDALCALRAEAEQFIEWRHGMGQGAGALSWGLHQQNYSAELHVQHCALAAKLKAACERRCPGKSQKWIDAVFATPGRYGPAVTAQAQTELGL